MRTQEQILAQCEARYAELEKQAEEARQREEARLLAEKLACKKCKHFAGGTGQRQKCKQPLIVGFDARGYVWAWDCKDGMHYQSKLCGSEKALWEAKPLDLRDYLPDWDWPIVFGILAAFFILSLPAFAVHWP